MLLYHNLHALAITITVPQRQLLREEKSVGEKAAASRKFITLNSPFGTSIQKGILTTRQAGHK